MGVRVRVRLTGRGGVSEGEPRSEREDSEDEDV